MSGAPNIQILDPSLTALSVTDDYESLVWTERWNEPGDFSIRVPLTPENLGLFAEDNFIRPYGTKKMGIIERIETQGDARGEGILTVSGRDALSLLDRRVIVGTLSVNGLASTFCSKALSQSLGDEAEYLRRIPVIGIGDLTALDAGQGYAHRAATYRNLREKICQVAEAAGCAISADYDASEGKIMVTAKSKRNRAGDLVFSEGRLNLLSSRYSCDSSALVTNQYIGGAGEGDDRVFASYSDSQYGGIHRHEGYQDQRDQGREMALSDAFERFVPPGSSFQGVELQDYEPVWETDSSGTTALVDITAKAVAYYRIARNIPIATKPISMRAVYSDGRDASEQEAFSQMLDGMKALYDQYSQYDPTLEIETVTSTSGVTLRWSGDTVTTPAWSAWGFDPTESIASDEEVTIEADKYAQILAEMAKEIWSESQRAKAFDGTPDISMLTYRHSWALGDVCRFRTRYGISATALIVEAVESWDSGGYEVTPGFVWD